MITRLSAIRSVISSDIKLITEVGTAQEVVKQLSLPDKADSHRYIVWEVEGAEASAIGDYAKTMASICRTAIEYAVQQDQDERKAFLELMVRSVPRPTHFYTQVKMEAEARNAVLASADWLTAAQLAEIAGLSTINPSAQPNKWKRDRQIFAIAQKGADYFPSYGLDAAANYRPLKALADVLAVFGDHKDGWRIAAWFASVNGYLDAKRPMDLLATDPIRVIEAARDEVEGPVHG